MTPAQRPRVAHVATIDLTLWYMLRPQLTALAEEGYEVSAISAPGERVADLEADGVRHIPWRTATRGWNLAADARAFIEIVRILRRERFDIVHTHNPKPGVLGRIAGFLARTPVVVNTQHGFYATPEDPRPRKAAVLAAEWLAARFSDAEMFQSEEDLRWAAKLGIVKAPKALLLGNGINLEQMNPDTVSDETIAKRRAELGIPDDAIVVGAVGRLVAEKGYRELFEAAARVRASHPNVVFLVVGGMDPEKWDSISRDELDRAAEHVVFAGHRDDVRDLLAVMDVFVLASWREGLPRSAIEAAAMGLPLILTNIRGCREVVRDGIEGMLVPPRNTARLAEAIESIVADGLLRGRFGEAARARALERFDERRVVETVKKTYRSLLGGRRKLPAGDGAGADGEIFLRPANVTDIAWLSRLHAETLPKAFLPQLGDRFLRRLYKAMIADPVGVVIVAEQGDRRVGFATGVASVSAFYRRFFRRHAVQAAFAAGPRLLKPSVLRHVRETARYPDGAREFPEAEFITWGIEKVARRRGLGTMLSEAMVSELGKRGAEEVKGVAFADNEPLNQLFNKTGWEIRGVLAVHDGKLSNVWVKRCPSRLPSESPSS